MFKTAKSKELQSWISNEVVKVIDSKTISKDRIIKARWVLNWKKGDEGTTAKARLVLLGYLDPDLGHHRSDAPHSKQSSNIHLLRNSSTS